MDHSLPLISTLAIAFGLAIGFGYIAERCRFPALVGYLVAGIMAGKHTWGPVADMNVASQLMEVGVMLLMFGVGLHFSVTDLLRVKKLAVPGALLQMASATVLGAWMAHEFWQWPISSAVVFGLCLSCASTVVLLKALEMEGTLNTVDGRISVGWLVVEDIICVLILVLLPAAAAILMGRALKAARRDGNNVLRVGVLTLAMSAAITALSFVLLEDLYLNRYWIPLMTLGAPVMAACLSRENNAPLRNVCVLLFAGVVVVSSAMQIAGSMKNPEITSVQRERAAHLQNNGLTFGYATFWNANVVTELTDGDVEAVAVSIDANAQGQGVPHTSMWLEATADRRMERPDEPVFLMLTAQESGQLSDFLALSGAQKRWEQSGMTIYEIESQRVFFETAQTMDAQ